MGSVEVSYSPEDISEMTDKKEAVIFVEASKLHQLDSEWSILGSTFISVRILKWTLVSITFLIAFFVFYHWLVLQAFSNVEHKGEIVAESHVNVESKYAKNGRERELIQQMSTLTTIMKTVASSSPTTTGLEVTSTKSVPSTTTAPTTTTTMAPTTSTTKAPTTTTTEKPKLEGNVEIKVIRASLPKFDFWSDTDPFVKVSVANRFLGQTSLITNNRYPRWNEFFTANNLKVDNRINFMVYDSDVSRNVLIGEKSISIMEILKNYDLGRELRLEVCGRHECEIFVQVRWTWI